MEELKRHRDDLKVTLLAIVLGFSSDLTICDLLRTGLTCCVLVSP
jgi:hypothetical protein